MDDLFEGYYYATTMYNQLILFLKKYLEQGGFQAMIEHDRDFAIMKLINWQMHRWILHENQIIEADR